MCWGSPAPAFFSLQGAPVGSLSHPHTQPESAPVPGPSSPLSRPRHQPTGTHGGHGLGGALPHSPALTSVGSRGDPRQSSMQARWGRMGSGPAPLPVTETPDPALAQLTTVVTALPTPGKAAVPTDRAKRAERKRRSPLLVWEAAGRPPRGGRCPRRWLADLPPPVPTAASGLQSVCQVQDPLSKSPPAAVWTRRGLRGLGAPGSSRRSRSRHCSASRLLHADAPIPASAHSATGPTRGLGIPSVAVQGTPRPGFLAVSAAAPTPQREGGPSPTRWAGWAKRRQK